MGPSLLFPGLPLNENTRRTTAQKIRTLFAGSIVGAWYDPSDLSTIFGVWDGTYPVTATGQSVGLILDKRFGLVRGIEELVNNDFATGDVTGWSLLYADIDVMAGACTLTNNLGGSSGGIFQATLVVGEWYEITINRTAATGASGAVNAGATRVALGSGVNTYRLQCTTNTNFQIDVNSTILGHTITVRDISVKHLPGNHAYQATGASRPIFRDVGGLRYLEFDGVDDYLRATFTIAQPIDRISAIRQVTSTPDDRLFGGATNAAGSLYQTGTSPRFAQYSGTATFSVGDLPVGINGVVTEKHEGATSRLAVNNIAYTVGNAGTDLPGGITIGASDLSANPGNLFLHQLIMRGGPTALTDTQITLLRKVCYAAAGLPFPGYEETEVSRMFSSAPTATGAWYDPSDLSTMFQERTGETPVTATGQSVGLILDKRLGLARGANFFSGLAGGVTANANGTVVASASLATCTCTVNGTYGVTFAATAAVIGTSYRWEITISANSAGKTVYFDFGGITHTLGVTTGTRTTYTIAATLTASPTVYVVGGLVGESFALTSAIVQTIAGNHATQTTSASRPTFREVSGVRYLEFDGVDDYLRSTFTIAQPIDRISAIQQVAWTNGEQIFGGSASNTCVLMQATSTPTLALNSGSTVALNTNLAVGTNGVITELHQGASSRLAINSTTYTTGNAGTTLPGGVTIGASSGALGPSNMYLYQMIMRGSTTAMTDAQIAACRALCAVKSGVTL